MGSWQKQVQHSFKLHWGLVKEARSSERRAPSRVGTLRSGIPWQHSRGIALPDTDFHRASCSRSSARTHRAAASTSAAWLALRASLRARYHEMPRQR